MTDKELRKLSKADLLSLLAAQSKEMDRLKEELAETKKKLEDRNILIEKSGSLADASLAIFRVLEDAQKAADLYLENIRSGRFEKEEPAPEKAAPVSGKEASAPGKAAPVSGKAASAPGKEVLVPGKAAPVPCKETPASGTRREAAVTKSAERQRPAGPYPGTGTCAHFRESTTIRKEGGNA